MDRDRRVETLPPVRPVEFQILLSLAAGERHGYGMLRDAHERGEAVPDIGTLYRALARMVDHGLIAPSGARRDPDVDDERRNYYRITELGRRIAKAEARRLEALTRAAPYGRPGREGDEMKGDRFLKISESWFRLLLRLYPPDFRDEMGEALVETYRDRAREALKRGLVLRGSSLAAVWWAALRDSLRNGPAERVRPAASWRRSGNWGGDMERVIRRLARAPLFVAAVVATLTVGLGGFAVVRRFRKCERRSERSMRAFPSHPCGQ